MAIAAILVGILLGSAITLAVVYMTIFSRKVNTATETDVEPVGGTTRSLDNDAGSTNISHSVNKTSSYAAAVAQSQGGGLLTGIMAQLWSHMNIAIAKSVKETVEPMFQEMLPGPLASLHFTQLDLGSVPIRMDNVRIIVYSVVYCCACV